MEKLVKLIGYVLFGLAAGGLSVIIAAFFWPAMLFTALAAAASKVVGGDPTDSLAVVGFVLFGVLAELIYLAWLGQAVAVVGGAS